jgi:hypothetical protein
MQQRNNINNNNGGPNTSISSNYQQALSENYNIPSNNLII